MAISEEYNNVSTEQNSGTSISMAMKKYLPGECIEEVSEEN